MPQHAYAAQNGGILPQFRSSVLVAAGSNQFSLSGSPTETIAQALKLLSREGAVIRSISRFFQTPCFPEGAGPDFVNAALELEIDGGPREALALLHRIERELGRERKVRWGQRTLDLDLIACGQQVFPDRAVVQHWMDLPLDDQMRRAPEELVLPHPRMHERAFVLVPLMDIAPQWVHPLQGRTIRQILAGLPDGAGSAVKPLVFRPENQYGTVSDRSN